MNNAVHKMCYKVIQYFEQVYKHMQTHRRIYTQICLCVIKHEILKFIFMTWFWLRNINDVLFYLYCLKSCLICLLILLLYWNIILIIFYYFIRILIYIIKMTYINKNVSNNIISHWPQHPPSGINKSNTL